MIIIGQFTLLLCPNDINCEPGNDTLHLLNSQKGKIYCHISLGKQYQYSHGTLTVIAMMFMLLVEIPTSIFLLMGARLRLRYNLIPWLVVTAFKMIFWVVLTCLVVWWAFKGMLHTMNVLSTDTMLDQTNKTLLQRYYLQYLGQNVSDTLKIGDGPSKGWYVKLCTITVLYVNSKCLDSICRVFLSHMNASVSRHFLSWRKKRSKRLFLTIIIYIDNYL